MATYYWVGGSGNWDATSTANWATSSGGTGGAGVPTLVDDVIFDANSNVGTGAFTVTVVGTASLPAVCRNFSTGGAGGALDGAMTVAFASAAELWAYGSLTLPATNLTWSGGTNAVMRFTATVTGNTVTTNGVTLTSTAVSFGGANGEWTLGSALTCSNCFVNQGSLTTNNYNVTCVRFTSNSGLTRSITLGSSTVTPSSDVAVSLVAAGLTFNAGTSQITCTGASPTFAGAGQTFHNVSFTTVGASTKTITGANIFNNLTIASTTGTRETFVVFGANQTVNGTLTLGAANTAIRRIRINSDVIGTARTLTVATVATLADVDFRDITTAGASSPWSGTRLGDCLGNTGITFAAGVNKFWNLAAGGNWSATAWALSSGGGVNVNNFPLPQDTAIIENTGLTAGNTITVENNWQLGNVNASTRSTAATLVFASSIYGNLTLSTSITISGTGAFAIAGRGTQTITSAGRTFTNPISVTSAGTVSCADALTVSNTLTFASGILKLKDGATSTITTFATSGTTQKFLESTLAGAQATLSQASGTVNASNLTIRDINATGGATWNAYVDQSNIDAGNNDGWNFGISPVVGGAEYTYQLRSFTQPRRF